MNKKNMKTAFLGFLVACAGAYTAYALQDDDPRAAEFAQYISDDIDKMVERHLTVTEINEYVKSYRKNPALFECWLDKLVENSKESNRELIKNAKAIHKMDLEAGRRLAFGEALRRIKELPDTSANPSPQVLLQRTINGKANADINIALSNAALGQIKSEK